MDELAKRFADLAEKYGPHVYNAAIEAARMEAYSNIRINLVCIVVGGLMVWQGRKLYNKNEEEISFGGGLMVAIGGLIAVIGIGAMLDPWIYATIHNPELWLAKRAFGL